ncbi:MAG: extensin family protein [Telmatospirillum sp.]|nr:extensin family protein [Telmatospirillum sp.]
MSIRKFLVALALLGMAACAPRGAPPVAVPETPPPAAAAPTPQACFAALDAAKAKYERRATQPTREGCSVAEAVMLEQATIPLNRAALMSCPLAAALAAFEQEVVQPAAQRHFGRPVVLLVHYGAYVCKPQTGRPSRLSEHAFGQAIDVGGFELPGRVTISVRQHWGERGPRGAFLREVAQGACRHFNMVLTPKSDAAHSTHLHLDMGRFRRCDA